MDSSNGNVTEYTRFDERFAHDQSYPTGPYALGEAKTDSRAFHLYKEVDAKAAKENPTNVAEIHKSGEIKYVTPIADLRKLKDTEQIRDGLSHPAVLNDLNVVYFHNFNEAASGVLGSARFLEIVVALMKLRENPDQVFEQALRSMSTEYQRSSEGTLAKEDLNYKAYAEGSAKWCNALSEKISKYPNAFLYCGADMRNYSNPRSFNVAMRPLETDNVLYTFTPSGLFEISAEGFVGNELSELLKVIEPGYLHNQSEMIQRGDSNSEIILEPDRLSGVLLNTTNIHYPEQQKVVEKLISRNSPVKIKFKMGYDPKSMNITEDELRNLQSHFALSAELPWPKVEHKEDKSTEASNTPSGVDILSMM